MVTFDGLLAQLRDSHQQQVAELQRENAALRTWLMEAGLEVPSSAREGTDFGAPERGDPSRGLGQQADVLKSGQQPAMLDAGKGTAIDTDMQLEDALCQNTFKRIINKRGTFGDLEVKAIDFNDLAVRQCSGREWRDLGGREKVNLLRTALKPRHRMLNPQCSLMQCWDLVHACALWFIGLATPYEVVFLTDFTPSVFVANRVVDTIFIVDIVLRFFLLVQVQRPHRGGSFMLRDPWEVRMRYLKGWFALDLVSVFPYDILSLTLGGSADFWRRAKILRCLKLLRLTKLLRMLSANQLQQHWRDAIGLRCSTHRLLRFSTVLLLVSHWMACLWGLSGLWFGASLCDDAGQLSITGSGDPPASQASWVTALYINGKNSPDSPCDNFDIYLASLHWSVMTLTSIGYGDIVPVRAEEYVVCIACMICGGVLWAYVIGCVCSLISNGDHVERNFETNIDLLNIAMREAGVPHDQRSTYREYLREAKAHDRRISFNEVAGSFSPMLRKQLMYQASKDTLASVYYLSGGHTPRWFLMEIASAVVPKFFALLESLDSLRHCLCMMDRGTVAHCGMILVHPSSFHEDFIISEKRYQKVTRTVSLTYTQVLVLTKDAMDEVLKSCPLFERQIRRCAVKVAFCRAVKMTMLAYERFRASMPPGTDLTLAEAFDRVRWDSAPAMPKGLEAPGSPSNHLATHHTVPL